MSPLITTMCVGGWLCGVSVHYSHYPDHCLDAPLSLASGFSSPRNTLHREYADSSSSSSFLVDHLEKVLETMVMTLNGAVHETHCLPGCSHVVIMHPVPIVSSFLGPHHWDQTSLHSQSGTFCSCTHAVNQNPLNSLIHLTWTLEQFFPGSLTLRKKYRISQNSN